MSAYTVIIQPEAELDLDDAYEYFERQRAGLGTDVLAEVVDIIVLLEENPFLFQKVYGEKRRAIVRRYSYQLIYVVKGKEVYILAFLHGSRNPDRWQRR